MQFVRHVAVSTVAQTTGRAVNVAIAFCILNRHGATSTTDDFFLAFAIAFFFFGTLAGAITDATVPLVARRQAGPAHSLWVKGAGLVALISGGLAWSASAPGSSAGGLISIGSGLMAGSGVLAGLYTAHLHANSQFGAPGLLWLVRLLPLALFLLMSSAPAAIGWLAVGLGLADVVRCVALRQSASPNSTVRAAPGAEASHRRLMLLHYFPILSASAINGLNPLVDRWIARHAEAGSITILDMAERVYGVLGTLSTIGVMSVLLVLMSRLQQKGALHESWPRILLGIGAWSALWLAGGLTLGSYLPAWFEQYAGLEREQAAQAGLSFIYYMYGLPAFIVGLAAVRRLLALGGGHLLAPIAVLSLLTNTAVSIGLFTALGVPGIALGTTATYSLVTILVLLATPAPMGPPRRQQ